MTEKLELWFPIKNAFITQGWGVNGGWYRSKGINIVGHNGIDFIAWHGQPVHAAHDGIVTFSGIDKFFGEYIEISTTERKNIGGVIAYAKTVYVHFYKSGRLKFTGDRVKVGDVIGYADSTGLSTGTHLHFGLKRGELVSSPLDFMTMDPNNGYLGAIDPTPFWTKYAAEDAEKVTGIMNKMIELLKSVIGLLTLQKK
ncbi:MAG: M23 family metallopeptidase [Patescibacteria group bacterium]|jgi:murein DD-endopeptidase MepM/ murein hydrolase activator NlpD